MVDRAERDIDIVRRRAAGETLDVIGTSHGITRERVRQILIARGGPTADQLRAARLHLQNGADDELRRQALAYIAERPGTTRRELAFALGVPCSRLAELLDETVLRRLVRVVAPQPKISQDQIAAGLRRAAGVCGEPLSSGDYESVRDGGQQEPSAVRIVQVFGSWNAACAFAGLAVHVRRRVYTRAWSEEQILGHVADYLMAPGSRATFDGYVAWARSTAGAPSAQTVRNTLGPWSVVKAAALAIVAARQKRIRPMIPQAS